MAAMADGLAGSGLRIARFEFAYMAARRITGKRRPPPRAPILMEEWRAVIEAIGVDGAGLVIGGKSLGGRMAAMIADQAGVRGLVCLGYPFHAPGKAATPERLAPMATLTTPTLIVQGARDAFGSRTEIEGYALSPAINIHWSEDGNHSLKPRVASGRTEAQNIEEAITAVAAFVRGLGGSKSYRRTRPLLRWPH